MAAERRRGVVTIPMAVIEQALAMAEATQQTHYIVREHNAWLVTPEHHLGAPGILPPAPKRKGGLL